jgi:perosamine synthetase
MNQPVTRRNFLSAVPAAGLAMGGAKAASTPGKPAILGGSKVRTAQFPSWPVFDQTEERALLEVLRSGHWFRGTGQAVKAFEAAYAQLTGAKFCQATANGTAALYTSLNALGVEPGDEVLVPPYTFIATVNVVLRQHALPVFVDSDIETSQMDARKIEAAITERTKAIVPVHLGGSPCDLDAILAIARKHNIPVIEDACQAHLAEWRGRKVGTWGATGCFSFQASKNLNSGEGGAILTADEAIRDRCYTFQNSGSGLKYIGANFTYAASGTNLRMTEFQGAMLQAQMTRIEKQAQTRTENARYLTSMLKEIPGIVPARMYDGCTRNAYHLFMLRYHKEQFAGLSRERFLKALSAEGIPAAGGYAPLNTQSFIRDSFNSRGYRALYPKQVLDQWRERTACPVNDRLCAEAVWFGQTVMLASRTDMEQIAEAVRKIQHHAADLVKV